MTYLCDPAGRNRPSCDAYIGVCTTTLLDCCRELGIRTPEAFTLASFQDWCHQPLGQLSVYFLIMSYPKLVKTSLQSSTNSSTVKSFFALFASGRATPKLSKVLEPPKVLG